MEGARRATRDDAEACAALCRQAVDGLESQRGGPLMLRRETGLVAKALLRPGGLDGLLAAPRRLVLMGMVDDTVVGMAVAHVEAVGEAHIGVIDGCFVELDGRGVGVGRAMLDGLMTWFRQLSCRGVDAAALPGDRNTKNFFEAAGFKARLLTLHHRIDQPD